MPGVIGADAGHTNPSSQVSRYGTPEITLANLRVLMRLRKWGQSDLARASQVHVSYVNQLLSGRRSNPGLGTLERLARAFGLSPAVLIDRRLQENELLNELSRAQLRLALQKGVSDHRAFYRFIDTPLAPISIDEWRRLAAVLDIALSSRRMPRTRGKKARTALRSRP